MELLLGPLPKDVKGPMLSWVRGTMTALRMGAPQDVAAKAENLAGRIIPVVTADTADAEVAVAHGLDYIPRTAWPVLALQTVNSTLPELTVTRAADRRYFYVSSPIEAATVWLYVE